MKNKEIKNSIKKAGLFQWQIAEAMGIQETALSRKMRHELSEEEKNTILEVIKKLQKNKGV